MKGALSLLGLLICGALVCPPSRGAAPPEDVQLRQQAVSLLERANAVSIPAHLPNLERIDSFLAFDASYGTREGTFTRVVIQGTGRRDETTFGSYHLLNVFAGGHIATARTGDVAPPEVHTVMNLTPIWLVRFDHEDIIRSITDGEADGRALRCIQFDTVAGEKVDNNEICVDAASGALAKARVGKEQVENSDFFSFDGALWPAKISYWYDGVLKLQITQTMNELADATPDVLQAPPDAKILTYCHTFRRAFGQFMPQPEPGKGGNVSDVLLRGMIGSDGKVHEAVVQSSDRPDLNAEALTVIGHWTFQPSLCDGKPNSVEASFTLHFQGR